MTDQAANGHRGDDTGPGQSPPWAGRREFLRGTGLSAFGAMLGMAVPFGANMPAGLIPAALAQDTGLDLMTGKNGLIVLGDRPLNAETPAHLLDDDVTPYDRLFIRMNGLVPQSALDASAEGWTLTVDGEVENPLELTIDELKSRFENVTRRLVLECGGNGRAFFNPGASGNQWTTGAVGCPEWTGVRLADVLREAGVRDGAVYTAHYGNDVHLSGDPEKEVISRGVPIEKAMQDDGLIAWAMNGAPIPALHGFPLRLVIPGYPGSVSQKYLTRIRIRDQVHDGAKMTGYSYRLPAYPVAPGTEVPESDMVVMTEMPVKSLITFPQTGADVAAGQATEVRGHAWAGNGDVAAMHVSVDFGQTWQEARLEPPANRFAWQRWRAEVNLPVAGYYEVWARATDMNGVSQPSTTPGWNPRGYGNNMQHRIALIAA
ncbi:Mo-co oxidoreductase dimerisation domain-containing protein [Paracoccus halophilus]|uniref:Mo-co oxidoreductase dimerisation domain-containing protein n=1 Tax=Paracoccus halophilus TaxID=376733 RepID=A0A099F3P5_9RHOB|nr:sulfite oxidase [Paracoccus halophilus]KGJ05330.1 molybdopterin containing oxidoreductase [Paracoccus halophilus]SFA48686.1 Mo-co oxidoreductase dimerisation domain-containing protein [Paracoccus halophilus]